MLSAASRFSAGSKIQLKRLGNSSALLNTNPSSYQSFISVTDKEAVDALRDCGVTINGVFEGYVTATIPDGVLQKVAVMDGVRHISLAQPLNLCNDTARYLTAVDGVHSGANQFLPLKGSGVIVGIIDVGIDYNHINLCDSTGKSRIKAAYLPADSTGVPPVVNGDTLPGSCYETPAQIALLTTDYTGSSHGTHTTGIAAGGYYENGWYGFAPEADIVACGMPSDMLTDVNLANALNYIFDYADRVGKPCIINMSIGSNEGPNDGTSFMCKTFEYLTGPGRLCVLAAGNDGHAPICFHQTIKHPSDTVTTLLRHQQGGAQRQGYVSMWSNDEVVHRSRLVVVNSATGKIEYASPMLGLLADEDVVTVSSDADQDFAAFYTGEVLFASAMEPQLVVGDGSAQPVRFHSYWEFDATATDATYLLGLQYVADEVVDLTGWCTNNTYFFSYGMEGVTGGSPVGSISDLATTDSVISVGAYCSRPSYIDHNGNPYIFSRCYPGEIAFFSSYGPDENGITRPDICAPGLAVISSANRFNDKANRQRWPQSVFVEGVEYPYYANQGTSMSAPMVSGTIALMLQINPLLTPSAVRDILRTSANRDNYVLSGDADRWGVGKLDAGAAVDGTIKSSFLTGDVNNDKEVNLADVLTIIDIILGGQNGHDPITLLLADVNHDHEIRLSDVNAIIDLILNN